MNCYAVENHPNDSRAVIDSDGIVQTLSSRMGTGGNNTPFVLITSTKADTQSGNRTQSQASEKAAEALVTAEKELCCFALDSHPMDSRINIVEGPCPSVTRKLAKMASDGPLVLIRNIHISKESETICGFDAFQHYGWRRSESFGPLTTGCGRVRGDTPLIIEVANE